MRTHTRSWLIGLTALTVLSTGALVGSALVGGSPTAAPAQAAPAALSDFRSCAALRDWYVASAQRAVGPYGWNGWNGGPVAYDATAAAGSASSLTGRGTATAPGALEEQTSSDTGTNVQESGVDESDLAKTDGRRLVRVTDGRLEVYDVTGASADSAPRRTGVFALPGDRFLGADGWELLLVGDSVVLVRNGSDLFAETGDLARAPVGAQRQETRVLVLRLTDGDPEVTSDRTFSGRVLATRQHGEVVRLVLQQGPPRIVFPMPAGALTGRSTPAQLATATLRNRALVRAVPLREWVPSVRETDAPLSSARPVVGCTDVLHPGRDAGPGTLSVVGFTPTSKRLSGTSITASGDQVYSADDSLYVATTRYRPLGAGTAGAGAGDASLVAPGQIRTEVHRFDLTATAASYVASGEVIGTLRDRWSMDAVGGRLRLAVEHTTDRGASVSSVVVLAQDARRLAEVGRVDGLGRGEQIKSVRWFNDLAVVVTFRQTDPLYVLDLADPDRPRLRGELKVPGFSGYLHPVGEDRLLGLGSDADPRTGATRGALVQVFDLADPDRPRQTSRTALPDLELTAPFEPRTLTWTAAGVGYASAYVNDLVRIDPDGGGTSAAPETARTTGPVTELLTLRVVGGAASVTRTRLAGEVEPSLVRTLPLADGRVALVTPRAVTTLG